MLTVIRLEYHEEPLDPLRNLVSEFLSLAPDIIFLPGIRASNMFTADLYEGSDWEEHCSAMSAFSRRFRGLLKKAASQSICAMFDVAIWPEDYADQNLSSFAVEHKWMGELVEADIDLIVSLYSV